MADKISVLISVYKEPIEYITAAVNSITNQTFHNLEIILICDNPSDITLCNYLKSLSSIDRRIRVVVNKDNIGLTRSLNKGLKLATGKYVARLDADDISRNDRLQLQYDFLESHSDIVVCGSNRYIIDENGTDTNKINNVIVGVNAIKTVFLLRCPLIHPSVMFRKSIIDAGFMYDETYECSQDYNFWGRLLENDYNITNIDECLIYYRVSSNQISNKKNAVQIANSKRTKRIFLEYAGLHLSDDELDLLVLPNKIGANPSIKMFKSFILLTKKIEIALKKQSWFENRVFRAEVFRTMVMLAMNCKNRNICLALSLWYGLKNPLAVIANKKYFMSRL